MIFDLLVNIVIVVVVLNKLLFLFTCKMDCILTFLKIIVIISLI